MSLARWLVLAGFALLILWNVITLIGLSLCVRDGEVTRRQAMNGTGTILAQTASLSIAAGVLMAILP